MTTTPEKQYKCAHCAETKPKSLFGSIQYPNKPVCTACKNKLKGTNPTPKKRPPMTLTQEVKTANYLRRYD